MFNTFSFIFSFFFFFFLRGTLRLLDNEEIEND